MLLLTEIALVFAVGMLFLVSSLTDYRPVLLKFGGTVGRYPRQYRAKTCTLACKV